MVGVEPTLNTEKKNLVVGGEGDKRSLFYKKLVNSFN